MTPSVTPPIIHVGLLQRLLSAGAAVTIDALRHELGWPAAQVQHELGRLAAAGCHIERHPHAGLRLVESGLGTWVDYLRYACGRGHRIVEVYRSTSSTQDASRRLIEQVGLVGDGAIVAADAQTAGRGRLGRRWFAPPGSALTFSRSSVRSHSQPLSIDRLTFATAVAVAMAIERVTAPHLLPVHIKWPNDLYVGQRKLAGILVETHASPCGSVAVVGVGINVNLHSHDLPSEDPDLRHRVTSLAIEGRSVDRLALLAEAVQQMDRAIECDDVTDLLAQWRQRSLLLSREVELTSNGGLIRGQVIDLDPWAGLIVRSHDGAILHLPAATTTMR